MKLPATLTTGNFIKRYKRFLVDVELENGQVQTVYCPNTGSMESCIEEGWPVKMSQSDNESRKYKYTLEMSDNGVCWIGVNTHLANAIVEESISEQKIPELIGYDNCQREVPYGSRSRIDILLTKGEQRCYVEVKNVTLLRNKTYKFPDSVSLRGQKHLDELCGVVDAGHRAIIFFLIQRTDGLNFAPAAEIDLVYAEKLAKAVQHGVEILAYEASVTPQEIVLGKKVNCL